MHFVDTAPEHLGNIADLGFAIGVGNFATGEVEVASSYCADWQELYTCQNWVSVDPVIHKGLRRPGTHAWHLQDERSEFSTAARDFGLASGLVASSNIGGSRCIAGISLKDPLKDQYLELVNQSVRRHHLAYLVARARTLSASQLDLVNLFAMGLRTKEVAAAFDVSTDAIKQRKLTIQRHIGVSNFLVVVNVCTRVDVENHLINRAH